MTLKCYKKEHSFKICYLAWSPKLSCNILQRYNQSFSRKWRLNFAILVTFRIFPKWYCHFCSGLVEAGCDVISMYVLQSYESCAFCKRKTRGETQFLMELAAPYTLANHNKINSDDSLPFIIFFKTPFSCNGSNRPWCQRWLLPTMFPMTSWKGIRRHSDSSRQMMPIVSPSHWTILFSLISLLSLRVLRSGFLSFCTNIVTI